MGKQQFSRFFHNLSIRNKLLLSYLLVGILPFFIFSIFLFRQFGEQFRKNAEYNFSTVLLANAANVQQKIEKVENSIQGLCFDRNIATILTNQYDSNFDKYLDVTKYFDSVLQTVLITTPELSSCAFYVPNNLADVRRYIKPLKQFQDPQLLETLKHKNELVWTYQDGAFVLYQSIFDPNATGQCAVLQVQVEFETLFDPEVFSAFPYSVVMGEEIVQGAENAASRSDSAQEISLFSGTGKLIGYMDKQKFTDSMWQNLILVGLGIGGVFVLLVVAINWFSRSFVRRINRMNEELAVTVENNFEITLQESYEDEIGHLTKMLNQMIGDTHTLIHDVYQSRLKQREYEIKALQAQINPHFLYNTLSAINWHAVTTKNLQISGIVTALSRFYRTALNQGNSTTTIGNELSNVRAYLDIQLAIHNHSFDVTFDVNPEINDFFMPNLILQPIVENAIEHGIDEKPEGRGRIEIQGSATQGDILFTISDNGIGISEEVMKGLLTSESKGYGLGNVNKRLALFYGDQYSLTFTSGEGTTAVIRIPKAGEQEG